MPISLVFTQAVIVAPPPSVAVNPRHRPSNDDAYERWPNVLQYTAAAIVVPPRLGGAELKGGGARSSTLDHRHRRWCRRCPSRPEEGANVRLRDTIKLPLLSHPAKAMVAPSLGTSGVTLPTTIIIVPIFLPQSHLLTAAKKELV